MRVIVVLDRDRLILLFVVVVVVVVSVVLLIGVDRVVLSEHFISSVRKIAARRGMIKFAVSVSVKRLRLVSVEVVLWHQKRRHR